MAIERFSVCDANGFNGIEYEDPEGVYVKYADVAHLITASDKGFKPVPVEPDAVMLQASNEAIRNYTDTLPAHKRGWRLDTETKARLRYAAMINAAPEPK